MKCVYVCERVPTPEPQEPSEVPTFEPSEVRIPEVQEPAELQNPEVQEPAELPTTPVSRGPSAEGRPWFPVTRRRLLIPGARSAPVSRPPTPYPWCLGGKPTGDGQRLVTRRFTSACARRISSIRASICPKLWNGSSG
ncbi:hypothetical protein EYF80_025877 [Liparis tanakae]|uniref:Uncharacterized protein n=1 Tax=Liparis tanakae TaxID=230148 RepID=A0A4Z2HFX8_9TELE|nr:hypothetical protein EYF80_025877 [Liparis tanakae]